MTADWRPREVRADNFLLADMIESFLIGYHYDRIANRFFFVGLRTGSISLADVDFIKFSCIGVANFIRISGRHPALMHFVDSYWQRLASNHVVLQVAVLQQQADTSYDLELCMGSALGGVRVRCASVAAEVKLAREVQERIGEPYHYYDLDTGEEFDFWDPFGDRE